jgi:hypothetical protein
MRKTLVCLANSYKHGGRCVAGVCVETGHWYRLRGHADDGSLAPAEYALADGAGDVRLMDVIEVELHYALPSDCHPEDWVIAASAWRLKQRPCSAEVWQKVAASHGGGGTILSGYRDRIAARELESKPLRHSLMLMCPDALHWWIREERGQRKCRALFHRGHVTYDLPVTDPHWLDLLRHLPMGIHAHSLLAADAKETWLAVSLSEAFCPSGREAWHFKLVAAVILRR